MFDGFQSIVEPLEEIVCQTFFVERLRPIRYPLVGICVIRGPQQGREVELTNRAVGRARSPSERRQARAARITKFASEVCEPVGLPSVGANKEQVVALPGGKSGILSARADQAAKHPSQDTRHASPRRQGVRVLELKYENSPRLAMFQRLDLPGTTFNEVLIKICRLQIFGRPRVGNFLDLPSLSNRPVERLPQEFLKERLLVAAEYQRALHLFSKRWHDTTLHFGRTHLKFFPARAYETSIQAFNLALTPIGAWTFLK